MANEIQKTGKKPDIVVRAGGVSLATWVSEEEQNGVPRRRFSTKVVKTYKKDDSFHETQFFSGVVDLVRLQVGLNETIRKLTLKANDNKEK